MTRTTRTFWHTRISCNIVTYSSDHSCIVRSFSIGAVAIKFRVAARISTIKCSVTNDALL